MSKSKIEWTDRVWNPTTGCNKVSQGCRGCYAERQMKRFWPERKFTDVRLHPERLSLPDRWRKPRRIFVDSMSDLFHPDVPDEFIRRVFDVMERRGEPPSMLGKCFRYEYVNGEWTPHTFVVLTKRPERMRNLWNEWLRTFDEQGILSAHIKHIILGVSIEDQDAADARIPALLETQCKVRAVSYEPALGPAHIIGYMDEWRNVDSTTFSCIQAGLINKYQAASLKAPIINLVIAGGESGPKARPAHPEWFRHIREHCAACTVPFFFKQWGEWCYPGQMPEETFRRLDASDGYCNQDHLAYRVGKRRAGRLLDGVEHNGWPEGLV